MNFYSFSKKVIDMERNIFVTLDLNIIIVSAYEFIKTYIYDFCHNNEKRINTIKISHHLKNIENASVYFAKLMLHDEKFCEYRYNNNLIFSQSAKAIACMALGFDLIRTNSKTLSSDGESLIKKWVIIILNY